MLWSHEFEWAFLIEKATVERAQTAAYIMSGLVARQHPDEIPRTAIAPPHIRQVLPLDHLDANGKPIEHEPDTPHPPRSELLLRCAGLKLMSNLDDPVHLINSFKSTHTIDETK